MEHRSCFVDLKEKIMDIVRECSVPNWDGYDARPLDLRSVQLVLEFLLQLAPDIPYPELCCEPSGLLSMVWRQGGYHLVFGMNASRSIVWGGTTPHGRTYGDAKFEKTIPEEVTDLLQLATKRSCNRGGACQ